jgi:hypothetical protein
VGDGRWGSGGDGCVPTRQELAALIAERPTPVLIFMNHPHDHLVITDSSVIVSYARDQTEGGSLRLDPGLARRLRNSD